MIKLAKSFSLACIVAVIMHADIVSGSASATCGANGAATVTNTGTTGASCSIPGWNVSASAGISVTEVISGNTASGSINGNAHSVAGFPINGPLLFGSFATAQATVGSSVSLYTLGPVRQGLVTVSSSGEASAGAGNDGASAGESFGSIGFTCASGTDEGRCALTIGGRPLTQYPITLGTSISFGGEGEANAESFQGDVNGGGDAGPNLNFTFEVFEADGVTPVELFEASAAPEPANWLLTALGVAILVSVPMYRRKMV